MKAHDRRVVHSSGRGDWETPPDLFAALHAEFQFTVDAAANAQNALCPTWYGPGGVREDALGSGLWAGRLFCNPPYGRNVGAWVVMASASAILEADLVAMLLPARTDTRWFHDHVLRVAEVRFIRGRLRFRLGGEALDPAPFPSMVVIWRRVTKYWR